MSSTANMMRRMPSVFAGAFCPVLSAGGAWKFGQFKSAVAVRSPHHGDVDPHVVESDHAVHSGSLDRTLAFQLQTKLKEEGNGSLEVVDIDAYIVHPLDRHRTNVAIDRCGAPHCQEERSGGRTTTRRSPAGSFGPGPRRTDPNSLAHVRRTERNFATTSVPIKV